MLTREVKASLTKGFYMTEFQEVTVCEMDLKDIELAASLVGFSPETAESIWHDIRSHILHDNWPMNFDAWNRLKDEANVMYAASEHETIPVHLYHESGIQNYDAGWGEVGEREIEWDSYVVHFTAQGEIVPFESAYALYRVDESGSISYRAAQVNGWLNNYELTVAYSKIRWEEEEADIEAWRAFIDANQLIEAPGH